jgi:hypothetical protein
MYILYFWTAVLGVAAFDGTVLDFAGLLWIAFALLATVPPAMND